MISTNDFRTWIARMGFNEKKQLSVAGGLLDMKRFTASETANGRRELTQVERLAMSAIRAGLHPWTPAYDASLVAASAGTPSATVKSDLPAEGTQG